MNCWRRQQLPSQMIQSYSFFWQYRKIICLCQLNMQLYGTYIMFDYMKLNFWLSRIKELYFQFGNYSEERESVGRLLRICCTIFHIWYVKLTWLYSSRMRWYISTESKLTFSWSQLDANENVLWFWTACELASGGPFLLIAKSMLWLSNRL